MEKEEEKKRIKSFIEESRLEILSTEEQCVGL